MTDDEQTDPEETGIEIATGAGGDIPQDEALDADAAAAATAAAKEALDQQVEDVKAGEAPPKALATPHGLEGDYDPVAEAEKLPPPPEDEGGGDDDADASGDADASADAGDEPVDAADAVDEQADAADADAEPPDADAEPDSA